MKYFRPLPSTSPFETIPEAQVRLKGLYELYPEIPRDASLSLGPNGVHYLLGMREGDWFRQWEERIRMGVRMRFKGEMKAGRIGVRGVDLDGY
jgi:hypothetical protein